MEVSVESEIEKPVQKFLDFSNQFLVVMFMKKEYLIEGAFIKETITSPSIYPFPHKRPFLKGLMSFKGNIVPVFHLIDFSPIEELEQKGKVLMFSTLEEEIFGLYIDEITNFFKLNHEDKILNEDPNEKLDLFKGFYLKKSKPLGIIDPFKILYIHRFS